MFFDEARRHGVLLFFLLVLFWSVSGMNNVPGLFLFRSILSMNDASNACTTTRSVCEVVVVQSIVCHNGVSGLCVHVG